MRSWPYPLSQRRFLLTRRAGESEKFNPDFLRFAPNYFGAMHFPLQWALQLDDIRKLFRPFHRDPGASLRDVADGGKHALFQPRCGYSNREGTRYANELSTLSHNQPANGTYCM